MSYHVFDLSLVGPGEVRAFLTVMAKEGLVGGVYLFINKESGKMYVGSSMNLYQRIRGYLNGSKLHAIIGKALRK